MKSRESNPMRKFAILLVALLAAGLVGCGSGVTVSSDTPVEIPQEVTMGGVTVQAPEQVGAGGVTVDTKDGHVTAK